MKTNTRRLIQLLSILIIFSTAHNSFAYEAEEGDVWSFHITPYLWLAGTSGTATVGPVSAPFDLSAIDILKMTKFGGMARLEVWRKKMRFNFDVIGMLLDEDTDLPGGITASTDLGLVILEWGGWLSYRDLATAQW